MIDSKNNWGKVCTLWNETCHTWGKCIADVVELIGGARDPQYWQDHPFDAYEKENELQRYQEENPEKAQRLIQIYVKCHDKKYNKSVKIPQNKIFITVNDVAFVLNELKSVGVDIKNIRKYKDDELHNLLG